MTPETDKNHDEPLPGLPREVRRHVLLSWFSLAAERLYPIIWPAGGFIAFFIVLALANVFVYLPEWLHLLLLTGFLGAIGYSITWSLRQSSIPTHAQALRHLEQTSGLEHRPLSALEDKPAIKRAISAMPVVQPIRVNGPNSVFALGNTFAKS